MTTPLILLAVQTLFNLTNLLHLADGVADGAGMTVQFMTPLVNIGVAGIMLWWFMARTEPRLKAIEDQNHRMNLANQEAMDRVARSNLLLVISSGLKPLQEQSHAMLAELDKSAEERKRVNPGN